MRNGLGVAEPVSIIGRLQGRFEVAAVPHVPGNKSEAYLATPVVATPVGTEIDRIFVPSVFGKTCLAQDRNSGLS